MDPINGDFEYVYKYGTAGFRYDYKIILEKIAYRIGIAACIISSYYYNGNNIGIMITASHNKVSDSGIKLVDPNGEILDEKYEDFLNRLINFDPNNETFDIYIKNKIKILQNKPKPKIILGMDTRPSGPKIKKKIIDGLELFSASIKDFGITTTPELHLLTQNPEMDYVKNICCAFLKLSQSTEMDSTIFLDCANGSASKKMPFIKQILKKVLKIEIKNFKDFDKINYNCGSDYVYQNKILPDNISGSNSHLMASLDGDADRLILYFRNIIDIWDFAPDKVNKNVQIIDGDKIGIVFAIYIDTLLKTGDIKASRVYVQTAYANGASTKFIKNLSFEHKLAATGVKNLHRIAKEYDIGIYFEPNGHGTVFFRDSFLNKLEKIKKNNKIARKILNLANLLNQKVGDGIANLLALKYIMHEGGFDVLEWNDVYTEKPFSLTKIKIKNKNIIKTNETETRVIEPNIIQNIIDTYILKYQGARAFVRPSGTEDCIRLYVEAEDEYVVKNLENLITERLKDILN